MHNNTNYHGWNKALTFGVGSIQLSFCTIVFTQYSKDVFNPNVTAFQSNCAEGLHFSAFHNFINNHFYNNTNYKFMHENIKFLLHIARLISHILVSVNEPFLHNLKPYSCSTEWYEFHTAQQERNEMYQGKPHPVLRAVCIHCSLPV